MKIVIKVGTSLITDENGLLKSSKIDGLVSQISNIAKEGISVLLVSSGAIAAGIEALNLKKRPSELAKLQAAAAVGQGKLFQIYSAKFARAGYVTGQVLLTQHDTAHREQYLNARHTLDTLTGMGVIPVINENDSVATEEIIRGDNDTLAGIVANIAEADLFVILSDVDGLMTEQGKGHLISEVEGITGEILDMAGGASTELAKGGMITKLQAAEIATLGQSEVIIANGHKENVLVDIILHGKKIGTHFKPAKKKLTGRKLWIAFSASERFTKGTLVVDEGAKKALVERGKSLLPAGVKTVISSKGFHAGDIIDLAGEEGVIFARGVSNYSNFELEQIKGKRSDEIDVEIPFDEIVHRDDLVILPITQQAKVRK